jgi:hypothetical protein
MSTTTPHVDSTLNIDDSAHLIAPEDLDFLDAIEAPASASEVLTGDTVLGRPTSGKPHGKVSDLLVTLNPGEFHTLGSCPFCPGSPSPKGKGTTAMVNDGRTRLTVMCWAADEHDHPADTIRTSTDGRTFAVWSWGPNAKANKDTIPTDDQSYLADHVLRLVGAKQGLLAIRNEQVMIYDDRAGSRSGGRSNVGCSPTWGTWVPYPPTLLMEFVRRAMEKLSVRTTNKDGVEGSRPVRVTVRLVDDVLTLMLRTLETREYSYIAKMAKRGDISFDEQEAATSRFDFCAATLLNPGTVLTDQAKQEIARPDHHVPCEARLGFAPDTRFASEWSEYVDRMIPDPTDRVALQMWVGAAILGGCSTKLQQHVILLGPPGTGKSQLIELLASIFPASQRSAVPLAKLADRFSAFGLVGKRINTSPEADTVDGRLPDVGALKMMLDGSTVQVERKNQQPVWTRIICAQLIAANDLPSGGAGEALYDRFRVIRATDQRMRHQAGAVAKWWSTKLHWRPAILAWAIEGLAKLDADGWRLPKSAASTEVTDEWREIGDSVFAWTRHLQAPPADDARDQWAPAQAAFDHYVVWCKAEGRAPLQNAKFGTRLKELVAHTRTGGRAYQLTILKTDPGIIELFPAAPSPEKLIIDAWDRQDTSTFAALVAAHPAVARRVFSRDGFN